MRGLLHKPNGPQLCLFQWCRGPAFAPRLCLRPEFSFANFQRGELVLGDSRTTSFALWGKNSARRLSQHLGRTPLARRTHQWRQSFTARTLYSEHDRRRRNPLWIQPCRSPARSPLRILTLQRPQIRSVGAGFIAARICRRRIRGVTGGLVDSLHPFPEFRHVVVTAFLQHFQERNESCVAGLGGSDFACLLFDQAGKNAANRR